MQDAQGDPDKLRHQFWEALEHSPYLMLELDSDPDSAAPMTAQLDKDAQHEIWFFTTHSSKYAKMGTATGIFSSKGHDLFARFHGELTEETSRERLDKQWSNMVEAWFCEGKDDPNLLMLNMKVGDASIWSTNELGLFGTAKMILGMDVRSDTIGTQTETRI